MSWQFQWFITLEYKSPLRHSKVSGCGVVLQSDYSVAQRKRVEREIAWQFYCFRPRKKKKVTIEVVDSTDEKQNIDDDDNYADESDNDMDDNDDDQADKPFLFLLSEQLDSNVSDLSDLETENDGTDEVNSNIEKESNKIDKDDQNDQPQAQLEEKRKSIVPPTSVVGNVVGG